MKVAFGIGNMKCLSRLETGSFFAFLGEAKSTGSEYCKLLSSFKNKCVEVCNPQQVPAAIIIGVLRKLKKDFPRMPAIDPRPQTQRITLSKVTHYLLRLHLGPISYLGLYDNHLSHTRFEID